MRIYRVVIARDSKADFAPKVGLSPQWVHLTDAESREQVDDKPEFHELGGGHYQVSLPVRPGQVFFGLVDLGESLASGSDRYVDVYFDNPACRCENGGVD